MPLDKKDFKVKEKELKKMSGRGLATDDEDDEDDDIYKDAKKVKEPKKEKSPAKEDQFKIMIRGNSQKDRVDYSGLYSNSKDV